MRIILDTNVIIAAFSSRGLCSALFELCIAKHEIIISEHIINELKKNLSQKIKLTDNRINKIIEYLRLYCKVCKYKKLNQKISRDKDDDEILALGKYNKVEYIITGDKDLLVLKKYEDTSIFNPREFWELSKKL